MNSDNIKSNIEYFFKLLWVWYTNLDISIESWVINIKIQTEESSLLIGYSWNNLESIRLVLKNILWNSIWENISLHIEVNDYITSKENKLFFLVDNKIRKLDFENEIILPFLNSYERKKVHSYIIKNYSEKWIFTKSIWEWKNRRVHLFKKSPTLTIDIDWIDI